MYSKHTNANYDYNVNMLSYYQYNGVKARERTFSSKQVKKLEGVVLNRVRVSNAQWPTYSQYRSSTPPPLPPRRGLWCRLISLWHCFSRQSAAVHQRLVRGCFKRNFFLYVKGNVWDMWNFIYSDWSQVISKLVRSRWLHSGLDLF